MRDMVWQSLTIKESPDYLFVKILNAVQKLGNYIVSDGNETDRTIVARTLKRQRFDNEVHFCINENRYNYQTISCELQIVILDPTPDAFKWAGRMCESAKRCGMPEREYVILGRLKNILGGEPVDPFSPLLEEAKVKSLSDKLLIP